MNVLTFSEWPGYYYQFKDDKYKHLPALGSKDAQGYCIWISALCRQGNVQHLELPETSTIETKV